MSSATGSGGLLELNISDGIATVTLDDPDRRNILSAEISREIVATVGALAEREDVAALVVTGRGRAFCAGADLADLLAAGEGDLAEVQLVYDAFGGVADFPRPTIAAVNGPAVGAGLNLALACDVRLVGPRARFDSRFLAIGIHPGGGHAWMLERLLGPQAAAAMLLFGETIGAADAVRLGLAWELCEDASLLPRARELAARVAGAPSHMVRDMKDTLRTTPHLTTRAEALAVETVRQTESLTRSEAKDLIAALKSMISTDGPG
jgi:enoyl-CoA hydratase